MKKFRIRYVCVSDLTIGEIWPDGDAPDNPTADDVRRLINRSTGGIYDVLRDWNLHSNDGAWIVEEIDD